MWKKLTWTALGLACLMLWILLRSGNQDDRSRSPETTSEPSPAEQPVTINATAEDEMAEGRRLAVSGATEKEVTQVSVIDSETGLSVPGATVRFATPVEDASLWNPARGWSWTVPRKADRLVPCVPFPDARS